MPLLENIEKYTDLNKNDKNIYLFPQEAEVMWNH